MVLDGRRSTCARIAPMVDLPNLVGQKMVRGRLCWVYDDGTVLPVVRGGADDSGADDSGDDSDDQSGDDTDDLDEDEDEDDATKDKAVVDPDKKRLSDEAARRRRQARQLKQERDAARAELEQLKGKDKPEVEQIKQERDTLKQNLESAESRLRSQAVRMAILEKASELQVKPGKIKYIPRLIDLDNIDVDDDGTVDGLDDELEAIKNDNPEWFSTNGHATTNGKDSEDDDEEDEEPTVRRRSSGKAVSSKKKGKAGYDLATLQGRFPALRK